MEPKPVGRISARELNRSTADVLKGVRVQRRAVVITRHGDPIALLSPIASAQGIVALLDETGGNDGEHVQRTLEALTDVEKRVLATFPSDGRSATTAERIIDEAADVDTREVPLALSRLEVAGLIRKRPWGYVRL